MKGSLDVFNVAAPLVASIGDFSMTGDYREVCVTCLSTLAYVLGAYLVGRDEGKRERLGEYRSTIGVLEERVV